MSWPREPLRCILAAVDGSEISVRAAHAALALAGLSRARIVLLHVLDEEVLRELAEVLPDDGRDARRRMREAAERLLAELAERARKEGVECETRIEEGDPPYAIDAAARCEEADLVVVGKFGQRGFRRWFVGSVTRRLIESTRLPVLVFADAPAPTEKPEGREPPSPAAGGRGRSEPGAAPAARSRRSPLC